MPASNVSLDDFYKTALGQYVLDWELGQYDRLVSDCFGYNALQIGATSIDFLRNNRISLKIAGDQELRPLTGIRTEGRCPVLLSFKELPFEEDSFDLVLLPHTLEEVDDPHAVLREVHRILIPNGRVIITGFNLMSLWGLRLKLQRFSGNAFLPGRQFFSVFRLKDWLNLLNMNVDRGAFGCYESAWTLGRKKKDHWMEKAGDRWWPQCGAVFAISARKVVEGNKFVGRAIRTKAPSFVGGRQAVTNVNKK